MPYGVTTTGYTAPRAADFRTTMRDSIDARLSTAGLSPINWATDLIISQIVDDVAAELGTLGEITQDLWDSRRLLAATGQALDDIAAIRYVTRRPATRSTINAVFGGTSGVVVPAGAQVDVIDLDDVVHRWTVVDDVTLPDLSAAIQCDDDGPVTVFISPTSAQIVTPIAGWETCVPFSTDYVAGRDIESDAALRRRIQANPGKGNTIDGIRTAVEAVDGVISVRVYQNTTAAIINLGGGVMLDPHTIMVVVYPSTISTAAQEEVAQAIYDNLPGGIGTEGTVYSDLVRDNGQTERIYWRWGATLAVTVAINVDLMDGFALADVTPEIESQVAILSNSYLLGETARRLPIFGILNDVAGVEGVVTLLLNGGATDVTPDPDEVVVLGTPTVT